MTEISKMSKFLHDDDATDDDRVMTIPQSFLKKQPGLNKKLEHLKLQ